MANPSTATSTHLWAVDGNGRVYVIHEVDSAVESIHSSQAFPGAPPAVDIDWTPVDGSLDKITGGFSGLVCGTRGSVLYVRRGITYDQPLGMSWAKAFCDAAEIAVGSQCIIRRTSEGKLFVTKMNKQLLSTPVLIPTWNEVPDCTLVREFQHFVLDARDDLYIVSASGEVYGCFGIADDVENANWILVSKAPFEMKGSFGLLTFWRSRNNNDDEIFSDVCAGSVSSGSRALWCKRKGSEEIWQLVLSDFTDSSGKMDLKTNWVKMTLPKEDKIIQLCADKTKIDALYALADEGNKVVAYNVLQEDSGRIALPNPLGYSQPWNSIAVCCTDVITQHPTSSKKQPVTSIYPKLPTRVRLSLGSDLCCETGDCEFCKNAERTLSQRFLKRTSTIAESSLLEPGNSRGATAQKRSYEFAFAGSGVEGTDAEEEWFHTSLMHQPKRPRQDHPTMSRYFLLDGVKVMMKEFKPRRLYKVCVLT